MPRGWRWSIVGAGERVKRASIRERIALVGGELKIETKPGLGTSLLVELFLPAPDQITKETTHARQ